MDAARTLVNAFVGGRLDYCNSLLAGDNGVLLTKLQPIQNAVARKFDSITPVIRDPLHWLVVRRRIEFNIATLVYNRLNGFGPPYLADKAYSFQQCLDDGT